MNTADRMEAAAWVAKLHGPDRGPELEAGFRRWLAESGSHKAAFDMANELWGDLAAIPKSDHPIQVQFKSQKITGLPRKSLLALAASLAGVCAIAALWMLRDPAVTTRVGQLREVQLEDGSHVTLNTDTRIEIRYDKERRHIELTQGEALFTVAKDPLRPFSVAASGRQIVALGTSFVVRRGARYLNVTLIEGKVAVSSTLLSPGQRVIFKGDAKPSIDTPRIERITAWKQKQVSLDHDTLADAVSEMNRYSSLPIEVQGTAGEGIVITGIFRAGDSEEFARAVADSYGLTLRRSDDGLILAPTE